MPYTTTPRTQAYDADQALPQNLAHKPMFAVPYQDFDGFWQKKDTDIRYISVGLAQYNIEEVSIKTMRYVQDKKRGIAKWTRQAEELPPHRAIDMVTVAAKVFLDNENNHVHFPKETFIRQDSSEIDVTMEHRANWEIENYSNFMEGNIDMIKDRFNVLFNVLNQLKSEGKF